MSQKELVPEALVAAKYVYMEGYLVSSETGPATIQEAKRLAHEAGVKVAYTFSDPAMVKYFGDQSKAAVGEGVDCLFANEEEGKLFTGLSDERAAFEALSGFAETLVFTRSEKGAWIKHQGEVFEIDPNPVEAIDTQRGWRHVCWSISVRLTNALSIQEAGDLASKASSKVVTQYGPRLPFETMRSFLS